MRARFVKFCYNLFINYYFCYVKNKKIVIAVCGVLLLCLCTIVVGVVVALPLLTKTGIDTVQTSLKDTERKDFLNRVNLRINEAFANSKTGEFPTVELDPASPFLVRINGDVLENLEDTTADLGRDFCYARSIDKKQYSLRIGLLSQKVYSVGNSETLCNL